MSDSDYTMSATLEQQGYDNSLSRRGRVVNVTDTLNNLSFDALSTDNSAIPIANGYPSTAMTPNEVTSSIPPKSLAIDKLVINKIGINDYISSNNFVSGAAGWRIHGNGDAEVNNAIVRGNITATSGSIGGWTIAANTLYYNGSGSASIQTGPTVASGSSGVIMDQAGIRGYSATLGQVFSLPSDGSAPIFASGTINSTTFNVNTNAVIQTSSTVGNGGASSYGVLINNAGMYGCGPNQTLSTANFKVDASTGNAYFSGTVNASSIISSNITGGTITGSVITGSLFQTAASGQRTQIDSNGIILITGSSSGKYGSFKYGTGVKYGTGALAYINNSNKVVPFYISAEQTVADFHFYNRSSDPSGAAEIGDIAVVNGKLKICTVSGTPGTWTVVGTQT